MIFLVRLKELAIIGSISAAVVVAGGIFMAGYGFENIVLAYLGGTVVAALASSVVMAATIREAGSRLFSRYV